MDKKSVTTLTLKTNQQTYRLSVHLPPAGNFQISDRTGSEHGTFHGQSESDHVRKEGLIERNGYFASTGGRKAQIIRIVPDLRIAIGIGILKNMFHLVAVDLYGEAVAREMIPLAYEDTPEYYDTFAGEVLHFIKKN